jgi:hypothetical protein
MIKRIDVITIAGIVALLIAATTALLVGPIAWHQLGLMALAWLVGGIIRALPPSQPPPAELRPIEIPGGLMLVPTDLPEDLARELTAKVSAAAKRGDLWDDDSKETR